MWTVFYVKFMYVRIARKKSPLSVIILILKPVSFVKSLMSYSYYTILYYLQNL